MNLPTESIEAIEQLKQIDQLSNTISLCMQAQQRSLRNRLRRMRTRCKQGKDIQPALTQLQLSVSESKQLLAERKAAVPAIHYPESLPVSQVRQRIAETIVDHQVVIVAGETGSGKTTQIPKICLQLGRGIKAMIGHTQPRRIAARSVATRIAEELGGRIGEAVAYKIRFSDQTRRNTHIKLMTDGILLAEIQHDALLWQYDTIIIDEAHERSLNIDFLLGYLKKILPKRPDLKLIITSATINTERFSQFFHGAPIIEVSGRSYPVDIEYRPAVQADKKDNQAEIDFHQSVIAVVDEAASHDPLGDILIFLPGEREIRDLSHALRQHHCADTEILPLYSRLSPAEQDKIFKTHRGRRIILATNVAETSLTVPGIRFVIDSGLARISRYSTQRKIQCLPIESISQASANQRAGRCGRVAAGICFRMYAADDFNNRPEHTDPEIRRTHLAKVILQMLSLDLGRIEDFTFMDAPEKRAIGDGYRLLEELQAIEAGGVGQPRKLTAIGKSMVRLPLDPRLARMLIQADKERALHEVLIIVAALSVQDPRLRPAESQPQADAKHRLFVDDTSDFLSWLKLWNWYHEQVAQLSRAQLKKTCQQHYLAFMRLREWHDLHQQLLAVVGELQMKPNQQAADADSVHRSLLSGLLSQIALRHPEKGYLGARNLQLFLFPGSALAKKPPQWLMAASLLATTRVFARCAAAIDPAWLETLAAHLIKRQYSEPHWSAKAAQVVAIEKVSLYGLPIVTGRRIAYGSIDPDLSRQLFIRHALVQMEYHSHAEFFKYNRSLVHKLEKMEHKTRRKDLLIDEQARYDFFDARIAADICNGKSFEFWRKSAERQQPRLLFMSEALLLHEQASAVDAALFPNRMQVKQLNLKLSYHFDPSHQADGITVHVPLAALGQLENHAFEWLVPGMLVEKLIALIKGLPKSQRKHFVPAPDFARACADSMAFGQGSLLRAFSKQLQRMTGIAMTTRDWQLDKLPQHLLIAVSVYDEQGKSIARDTNLAVLQHRYGQQVRDVLQPKMVKKPGVRADVRADVRTDTRTNHRTDGQTDIQASDTLDIRRTGITRWDFGSLPTVIEQRQGRLLLQMFPALVDHRHSVAIDLFESRQAADQAMFDAVRRLFMLSLNSQIQYLRQHIPRQREISLLYAGLLHQSDLLDDMMINVFNSVFMIKPIPRNQADFETSLQAHRADIVEQGTRLAGFIIDSLKAHADLQQKMIQIRAAALRPVLVDIQAQLDNLMADSFVRHTPYIWLQHLPRFLQAAELRLARAGPNLKQDQANSQLVQGLWQAYEHECKQRLQHGEDSQPLLAYRWRLEELRVSLFAQGLKTSVPVSVKRLEKFWQELTAA
ncbi:MAG: ATP-dependent RNA helicase HrpA [Mariprofundus sp.]|nr:ATP-dependent RNA helicase HrpA [Mariprofundus sp.]